jgi:hypothetical protein
MGRKIDLCILICLWALEYRVYKLEQICSPMMTTYFTSSDHCHKADFAGADVRTKVEIWTNLGRNGLNIKIQWLRHTRDIRLISAM